jgi:hypothetical protein
MQKLTTTNPGSEANSSNISLQIQEVCAHASAFVKADHDISSAEDLENVETEVRKIADQLFQATLTPILQAAVDSARTTEAATELVRKLPRRLRSDGATEVDVRTSRGTVITVKTPYYRERSAKGSRRRPGLYPALAVLGIWDRCTPKLASIASKAVAMLGSLKEAVAHLGEDGIGLDVKTVRTIAYRYAARARAAQHSTRFSLGDSVAARRVVVSFDGGRVRVRRDKRGRKTRKGRRRFHTDWQEPKLLLIYVVGNDGRTCRTWDPIIDGTLRGPDAVYALLLSYARQLDLGKADKVLFVADGAPWIWIRFRALVEQLGLNRNQVLMLIDFYHAAQHLSEAIKLLRWGTKRQNRWLNHHRRLLLRGEVELVIAALRELTQGRHARKLKVHLDYFQDSRGLFAYAKVRRLKLPRGSGGVESAIRRVINLRIKGASIYWSEENVEAILLLRSFYKANRWPLLQRMATSTEALAA